MIRSINYDPLSNFNSERDNPVINVSKALSLDAITEPVTPEPKGLSPLAISTIGHQITLSYSVPASTPYTLSVYDVVGREVHNTSGNLSGTGQITCTPELSHGVYFWKISTDMGEESGKLIYVR